MPEIIDPPLLTLQFKYAPGEFVRGMRATYDRLARIGLVPALALIGLGTALVMLAFTSPRPSLAWGLAQIAISVSLGVAFALAWRLLVGHLGLRLYHSKPQNWQTLTVRASNDSLQLEGLGRTIVASWERIRGVDQRGDLYLIVLSNRSVHFIPERPLVEQGLLNDFRAVVRAKLGSRAHLS